MAKERPFVGSDLRFVLLLMGGIAIGAVLGLFSSSHLSAGMWMALLGVLIIFGYRYKELPGSELKPRVDLLPEALQARTKAWIRDFEYCTEVVRWAGNACFVGAVVVIYSEGYYYFQYPTFYPLGWMLGCVGCASRLVLPAWAEQADRFYREMNRLIHENQDKRKAVSLDGKDVKSQPANKPKFPKKSSQTLEDLIPRSKSIEEDLFRDKLLAILHSDGEILPPSDTPLGKLWKLVNSKHSTVEDLTEVVELDPALVILLFRTANSAVYAGTAERVTEVKEAIQRLGFSQLREIVFNAGVIDQFSKLSLPDGWEGFWLRNILIARLTERICSKFFTTNGTEYLAGLLHDSGLVFLATFFPDQFKAVFSGEMHYLEMEKALLPVTHASISAAICLRSLLPERVVNAVIYHHNPMMLDVYTADTLCQSAQVLGVVLNISGKLTDSVLMPIGDTPILSIQQIEQTQEVLWLSQFGTVHFGQLLMEELPIAREIFGAFHSSASVVQA